MFTDLDFYVHTNRSQVYIRLDKYSHFHAEFIFCFGFDFGLTFPVIRFFVFCVFLALNTAHLKKNCTEKSSRAIENVSRICIRAHISIIRLYCVTVLLSMSVCALIFLF